MKFTSALLASASLFVLGHCRPQDAPAVTPAPSLPAEEPPAAPVCSEGNNALMGMNNTPDKWCFCGGRGPFSTLDGQTTSYCAFSTVPTETISLTSHSTVENTKCTMTQTSTHLPVTDGITHWAKPTTYCQCGNTVAGTHVQTTTVEQLYVAEYTVCLMDPPQTVASIAYPVSPTDSA